MREGCVRETWGAAVAVVQGELAGDRAVRRAMRAIALDEAEHASLARAIDAWACPSLRPAELARVTEAREQARQALVVQARERLAPELGVVLGLPDPALSMHLLASLGYLC